MSCMLGLCKAHKHSAVQHHLFSTGDLRPLECFLKVGQKSLRFTFRSNCVARHGASTWRFTFSRPLQIAAHVTQEFLCEHHLPFESIWFMSVVACEGSASCCGGMAVILTRTSVAHINWKMHCFSHIFRFLVKPSRHAELIIQDFYCLLRYLPVSGSLQPILVLFLQHGLCCSICCGEGLAGWSLSLTGFDLTKLHVNEIGHPWKCWHTLI